MSNYNDNWKAFVNETKEMSDEQLQEYIGDIRSAVSGLSSQSGQGTQYSGLQTPTNKQLKQIARRKKQRAMKQKLKQGLKWLKNLLNALDRSTSSTPSPDQRRRWTIPPLPVRRIALSRIVDPEIRERLFMEVTKDFDKASKEIDVTLEDGVALTNTMSYIESLERLDERAKKDIKRVVNHMMKANGIPRKSQADPKGPKEDSVDVSELLNATTLDDYAKKYNKLVDADERKNIKKISRLKQGKIQNKMLNYSNSLHNRLHSLSNKKCKQRFR